MFRQPYSFIVLTLVILYGLGLYAHFMGEKLLPAEWAPAHPGSALLPWPSWAGEAVMIYRDQEATGRLNYLYLLPPYTENSKGEV